MSDPGIVIELGILYLLQTVGHSIFAVFELETPAWRLILKWVLLAALTLGLYAFVGHWCLLLPLLAGAAGLAVHFRWCRKHGIHPFRATPREKYYELRGWQLPE